MDPVKLFSCDRHFSTFPFTNLGMGRIVFTGAAGKIFLPQGVDHGKAKNIRFPRNFLKSPSSGRSREDEKNKDHGKLFLLWHQF